MAIMTVVGEYELIRKIGEGGYGKIFIARRVSGHERRRRASVARPTH